MSSKNDDSNGIIMVFAFFAAGAMVLAMAVFAILAFVSLIFTILSFCAWSKTLTLGKLVITPEEAHAYVYRGLCGAALLPGFCWFVELMFDVSIRNEYVPHIVLAGYALGSLGIEILKAQIEEETQADILPPQPRLPDRPQNNLPLRPQEQFQFASWDDEEERR